VQLKVHLVIGGLLFRHGLKQGMSSEKKEKKKEGKRKKKERKIDNHRAER